MPALKDTINRILRSTSHPVPPATRPTKTERSAAKLGEINAGETVGGANKWDFIAPRMNFTDLADNHPRDIRLAISRIWDDKDRSRFAATLVNHGLHARRKTFDRALLMAYLRRFPITDPAFPALEAAVGGAAERHDWPWRQRGRRWALWDSEVGPAKVGLAMLETDAPLAVLRDAGLKGDLEAGIFVERVLRDACKKAGATRGPAAEMVGRRLTALFTELNVGGDNALLAFGLLNPWTTGTPSDGYRKAMSKILVDRIGDPRFRAAAWAAACLKMRAFAPDIDPEELVAVLRRWLTQLTVKAFFKIVGNTTDRKDQWDAREEFWLGYLDQGAIGDAWFAFGRRAESVAGTLAREEGVSFGRVSGGCDPSHSALIMTLGDLRIAEWSHNGACRFWPMANKQQVQGSAGKGSEIPELYRASYDGTHLRSMHGPPGFQHPSHTNNWQQNFARIIYRATGVRHPIFGRGDGR